jgi:hypothetical protein
MWALTEPLWNLASSSTKALCKYTISKNVFQVNGVVVLHKHPSLHKKFVQQGFAQPAVITPPNPHNE